LHTLSGEWLVRVNRQRTGASVHIVVDVSTSMAFGAQRPKLHIAADFIEALGLSAFRAGDALGMLAFDVTERTDLFVAARVSRGLGSLMASNVRECVGRAGGIEGLEETVLRLAQRHGLIFIVSDFHWPLEGLGAVLDALVQAYVVPVIIWDPAEIEPPERHGLASLRDAESGARRTLWLRPKLRQRWRAAVSQRRAQLDELFAARDIRPFYVQGAFDGEAMSHYFFEAVA
jgi:uncharacterized protein (DUF58 family)